MFKRGRKGGEERRGGEGGRGTHIALVTRAFKAGLDYRFASGEGNCSSSLCLDTVGNKRRAEGGRGGGRKEGSRSTREIIINPLCPV